MPEVIAHPTSLGARTAGVFVALEGGRRLRVPVAPLFELVEIRHGTWTDVVETRLSEFPALEDSELRAEVISAVAAQLRDTFAGIDPSVSAIAIVDSSSDVPTIGVAGVSILPPGSGTAPALEQRIVAAVEDRAPAGTTVVRERGDDRVIVVAERVGDLDAALLLVAQLNDAADALVVVEAVGQGPGADALLACWLTAARYARVEGENHA